VIVDGRNANALTSAAGDAVPPSATRITALDVARRR
jgi:hypothetical protein